MYSRRCSVRLLVAGVCVVAHTTRSLAVPMAGFSELYPRVYEPLPLGSIAPQGWLLGQLVRQANSLSGHMSTTRGLGGYHGDSNVVNMTNWLGGPTGGPWYIGDNDQWFPYWANGNIPLVAQLRASGALDRLPQNLALHEIIDNYMRYVLDHDIQDGWIKHNKSWSPGSSLGEGGYEMVLSLLQWSETRPSSDRKIVAKAVISHLLLECDQITPEAIQSWTATRWPTFITLVGYAVDHLIPEFKDDSDVLPHGAVQTQSSLVSAAQRMGRLGMDWYSYYHQLSPYSRTGNKSFPNGSVPEWNVYDHGVNNAEGAFRWPSALYRLNGSLADGKAAMHQVLAMIDLYQGQINSVMCADEVFCGADPNRGTETCAIVEMMQSFELGFATLGEPNLMDRVERLAFNALPAALTGDMWTHVYVQQANSVLAGVTHPKSANTTTSAHSAEHVHPQSTKRTCERAACLSEKEIKQGLGGGPGPYDEIQTTNYYGTSHFPCCITNFPQGWPKFAQSAVLVDVQSTPPSIVLASVVPLVATVPQAKARIIVDTEYPFKDSATIIVEAQDTTTVQIRIPGWATRATVDGKAAANGTLVAVYCSTGNTTIEVNFNPEVKVEYGWGDKISSPPTNAVGFTRGALVFALHPAEDREIVRNFTTIPPRPEAPDYRISTNDVWNYAIDVGKDITFMAESSAKWSTDFPFDDSGEYPFSIMVTARQLSNWGYWKGSNITDAPPPSPVNLSSCGPAAAIRLVPFGSTNIRIAIFPWL